MAPSGESLDEAILRVRLEGKGELTDFFDDIPVRANKAERSLGNLSRAFTMAGGAISSFAGKAGSELQAFAGKELGGSLGSQARGVLQLRDAITALAVSSGHGTEIVGGLKDQIQAASKASNQLQGDVTDAMSAFVERTSDLETARRNIEMWGKTATATGTALRDIALVGETISTKFGVKDQAHVFDILVAQSKAKGGVIELHDIATKGPAIFSAAAAAGMSGEKGIREIGALTQLVAGSTGGPGTAAAASVSVNAIFSQIRQKASAIEGIGIKVQGRDQVEVLQDIIAKAKGDPYKLAEVFKNVRAFRGVEELAREYRAGRGFQKFEAFRDVGASPNAIDADFATRNSTGMAKLRQQEVNRAAFIDKYAGAAAEWGAAHAQELQGGLYGAGLLGKGLSAAGRLGGALGGRVGGAIGAATAQRVFVVNFPPGMGGGGGAIGGGAGGAIGKIGAAVGVFGAAYELTALADEATGGHVSGGVSRALGWVTGQKGKLANIEGAGADINQIQLRRRQFEREELIRDFEGKGLSHGKAIYAADQKIQAEVKSLTVVINGDQAHVETDTGTRSPKVMVKRGAGGG